jgi:lipopolysaccharide/colanic/teichoic acid biosynthesis glycosyltransferase
MRRLLDILFALGWLIVTFPVMAGIALCIRRELRGAILYVPPMVGQRGRLFPLFRFRTMAAKPSAPDPHAIALTRVGRFIRTYSLDHLPMLLNLLIGDLTLIGPRPMELPKVDMRDPIWQSYFSAKPGLFNYAVLKLGSQWTPRQQSRPEQNQQLEQAYGQQRSWRTDADVFLGSLAALIRSRGNIKERKAPDADVDL